MSAEYMTAPMSSSEFRELHGKSAIVTGSTSGIGLGIATALARAGMKILLNGFGKAGEIEALRSDLVNAYGVPVMYSAADVSKSDEIKGMVLLAEKEFGGVDVLVNNAGLQHVEAVETFPPEKWDAILAINLTSSFHTTRHVVPMMKARRWGAHHQCGVGAWARRVTRSPGR